MPATDTVEAPRSLNGSSKSRKTGLAASLPCKKHSTNSASPVVEIEVGIELFVLGFDRTARDRAGRLVGRFFGRGEWLRKHENPECPALPHSKGRYGWCAGACSREIARFG